MGVTHFSLVGSVRPSAPGDGQYGGENAHRFGIEVERSVRRERAVFEHVREEAFGNETGGGHGLDAMTLRNMAWSQCLNTGKQDGVDLPSTLRVIMHSTAHAQVFRGKLS